jgi:hypothetical protein
MLKCAKTLFCSLVYRFRACSGRADPACANRITAYSRPEQISACISRFSRPAYARMRFAVCGICSKCLPKLAYPAWAGQGSRCRCLSTEIHPGHPVFLNRRRRTTCSRTGTRRRGPARRRPHPRSLPPSRAAAFSWSQSPWSILEQRRQNPRTRRPARRPRLGREQQHAGGRRHAGRDLGESRSARLLR